MSWLFNLLTLLNLFLTVYLIFIVYRKNSSKSVNNSSEKSSSSDNDSLRTKLDEILKTNLKTIKKVSLTRFNPFDDIGGDQSFILCLLDSSDNGVVLTSLHNKEITRIYAKAIKNGEGEGSLLSKEEKSAILKTIKV